MDLNYPQQTNETLLSNKNSSPRILHHEIVKNTNETEDKHIMLTTGPKELDKPNSIFEINAPGGWRSQLVTEDAEFAVRSHLHELEVHDVEEQKALDSMKDIREDTSVNIDELHNKPMKERAKNMINTSKYSYERYGRERPIYFIKNGNWRSKNPSKKIVKKAENLIIDSEHRNTQSCYKMAFLCCMGLRSKTDIDNDRISYCEGISISKYGCLPSQHAWVEVDNEVIEVTWPWSGPYPSKSSLYYGFEIKWNKVNEKMRERPTYASVLMPDEEYYSSKSVIKAIHQINQ